MNNRLFDERMRAETQKEAFTPTLEAEAKLVQAMNAGAVQWPSKGRKKPFSFRWMAAGAVVCAAVLALVFFQPFSDSQLGNDRQMVAAQPEFTPVPVTLPEVFAEVEMQGEKLVSKSTFANHTGDIWIIRWTESVRADDSSILSGQPKTIWLETGITYSDEESWPAASLFSCQYQTYRVTAKVLHWMDGEWLRPGQDGYADQQSLMEDALAAGAIILYPGNWPEGESGEMTLLLPDSASSMDPLAYYAENGMLQMVLNDSVQVQPSSTAG